MWDDFPPIYVPSFALLQSSIPYTIEAPLQPGSGSTATRRADIDTDVHEVAIKTSLKYIQDHRNEVLFDQAEVYRRGWAGEPLRQIPDGYVPGWGPEDNYNTTFPRSYVIPAGTRQRSAPAAKRLVDLLIASGGRVTQAKAAFTAAGNSYPAGTYVINLHQPKRGIVNSLLEPGIDLTDRVDDLYAGPGAWSQALTWGATVDTLWDVLPAVETERVSAGVSAGGVPALNTDLLLDPQDAQDLLALNALLAQGVKVQRLTDGSILVPASARALAVTQATERGVTFKAPPASWSGSTLDKVVVAYVGGSELRDTLDAIGFEKKVATATTLATTLTSDVDVLVVGGTLNYANLNAANRAALDAFLARGGGVVGLGTAGSAFSSARRLADRHRHVRDRLASGVANVVNHGGPVSNGAQPHAFVFPPVWYTNLGTGAVVEQSYAADPLAAGWWRGTNANNTQQAAAGKASIVRAQGPTASGAVLIGTSVVTRLHAKGLQPQLGRAILWAAAPTVSAASTSTDATVGGNVPATLTLALGEPATFPAFVPGVANTYETSTTARIVSTAGDAALTVLDPSPTATGRLVNGSFSLAQPLLAANRRCPRSSRRGRGPTSNESVTVPFKQSIGANEPLRTGTYAKTLTFTLSTTAAVAARRPPSAPAGGGLLADLDRHEHLVVQRAGELVRSRHGQLALVRVVRRGRLGLELLHALGPGAQLDVVDVAGFLEGGPAPGDRGPALDGHGLGREVVVAELDGLLRGALHRRRAEQRGTGDHTDQALPHPNTSSGVYPALAGCGCLFQAFTALSPMNPVICCCTVALNGFGPEQAAKVERSAGNVDVTPSIEKQLSVPLPSYMTSLPLTSVPLSPNTLLRTMLRSRLRACGFLVSRMPSTAATPVRKLPKIRLFSIRLPRPPSSRMPVPIGTSAAVPSLRTANGGLPWWKLKLFQKMSLSMITLPSAGGYFSESSAFGTMPGAVVVEAALGDRHVAHVGGAEAERAAPALDVAHDRLDRVGLRRRLPDVERAVVDVVGLGVEDLAADRVERVQPVDAGLARDQVVHRVAVEVREEVPVGLVVARHEAVDGDLVGFVDPDPVLHGSRAHGAGPSPGSRGCRSARR